MTTLVLLSTDPADEAFAAAVAEVAGLNLHKFTVAEEAVQILLDEESPIFFVDCPTADEYAKFENVMSNKIGLFSDRVHPNRMHYISHHDLQNAQYLLQSPIFGHYISKKYGDVTASGKRYGYIVKAQLSYRCFGLQNLISPESRIQSIKFTNTAQKQQGVEAMKNYLISAHFKTRMATVIANAVDELVMNAMFDSAVDELGRQIYASTPRDTHIELQGKHVVEMNVGYDKEYVAINAVDHFGSLDKQKLFSHMSKRYVEEEYKVKASQAGAGIGLATVFRSGGSFLFCSERGERTEVTVFFRRTDNFREFKEQFRFISTQFYF